MYAPKQFREERRDVLLSAIGRIRLGTVVVTAADALEAAHLPMVAHERDGAVVLEGHVARGNPLWRRVGEGAPALAIFQGPQAYVHPGWLPTKRETGRVVPTWNYVAVHAHGRLVVRDERAWLLRHVGELTELTEGGRPEPWAVSDAPDAYVEHLLRGIVGLELAVDRLEGAWKLIQHHPDENRLGVIAGLSASPEPGDRGVAEVMRGIEAGRAQG